jgi:hypothetical protein
MPLKFWDEAFQTATYLINRLPSKIINDSSLLERLFHRTPDYTFLCTFGCVCWPHLHPYNSRKVEFGSKQCIFLGYSDMHKGYKCLEVSTSRVYISRDVIFDEEVFPFATLHPNAGAHLHSEINRLHPTLFSVDSGGIIVQNHVFDDSLCANPSTELAGENPIKSRLQIRPEQEEIGSRAPGTRDETDSTSTSRSAAHLPKMRKFICNNPKAMKTRQNQAMHANLTKRYTGSNKHPEHGTCDIPLLSNNG